MGLAQVTGGTAHLECTLGHMLGPIQYSSEGFTAHLPYQLVWGIPKGHKTEKWHLIRQPITRMDWTGQDSMHIQYPSSRGDLFQA